eukprot:GHVQ01030313.1.p1 GENE.GHVQ01030313.1~~GHVQ01030313.1.p1  ORF type:complete len:348 (-),score=92.84 GHVQ01030313.1:112-1134(-)
MSSSSSSHARRKRGGGYMGVCLMTVVVVIVLCCSLAVPVWGASQATVETPPGPPGGGEGGDESTQILAELEGMVGMNAVEMQSRLSILFDAIDTDKDGEWGEPEAKAWMTKLKENVQNKQVVIEMESIDKDGDGFVTFDEMKVAYADSDGDNAELLKRFNAVDKNKDNKLERSEIFLLMNPSKDDELMELEVSEILNAQDTDKDGSISLAEFLSTEEPSSPEDRVQYETEFRTYDVDGDGYINRTEIWQVVAEPYRHEIQEQVDELFKLSPDGKLTRDYVRDKFHKFVISAVTDSGEVLRYPREYSLDLFPDLPKPKSAESGGDQHHAEEAEEEEEDEEL